MIRRDLEDLPTDGTSALTLSNATPLSVLEQVHEVLQESGMSVVMYETDGDDNGICWAIEYTGCPRRACAHSDDSHGLFGGICGVEGCPCGESETLDARARESRVLASGWNMTPKAARARGFKDDK